MDRYRKATMWAIFLLIAVIVAFYAAKFCGMYAKYIHTGSAAFSEQQVFKLSISLAVACLPIETIIWHCAKRANMKKTSVVFGLLCGIHLIYVIGYLLTYFFE